MSDNPTINEILPTDTDTIQQLKLKATVKGLELLILINGKNQNNQNKKLQIATSESLTCGLIMSTLVDIPWAGYIKYGGFGVYDTDAKRVLNGVQIDNVYTNKCASEMAIGVLKNSNATIAIAVTGNAMPSNEDVNMLGEVFIGIAGYDASDNIIFITKSINACMETDKTEMIKLCKQWVSTITNDEKAYNPRNVTASVSQEIRYYTVIKAYEMCIEFISKLNPTVPDKIIERKKRNDTKNEQDAHTQIPTHKYDFGGDGICKNNNDCVEEPKLFKLSSGGKRKYRNKKSKNNKSKPKKYSKKYLKKHSRKNKSSPA